MEFDFEKPVTELEARILEGSLKPGDRLPAERELAVELGVSRPSLREAIQKMLQPASTAPESPTTAQENLENLFK